MSNIAVQKVNDQEKQKFPVFAEIGKRLEEIRCRAHDFFLGRGGEVGRDLDDWLQAEREVFGWAKAELTEKENAYEIQVTLPGFDSKEVQVTATPGEIVVHAATEHRKRVETPAKKEGEPRIVWSEFGSNEVYRRFELPRNVVLDKLTAKLEKGILHIAAPWATQAKPVAGAPRQANVAAA